MNGPDRPAMVHWYGADLWHSLRGLWRASDVLGILDARRLLPWEAGWRVEERDGALRVAPPVASSAVEAAFESGLRKATTAESAVPALPDVGFDFVADTGDGWDETCLVAYQLSRPEIPLPSLGRSLPRSSFLVMGGDEVYPVASEEAYEQRLLDPFAAAGAMVEAEEGSPPATTPVYAVPGNHDWYDGLNAFARLFCRPPVLQASGRRSGWPTPRTSRSAARGGAPPRRQIGCFRPAQDVSYFAFPLAYGWHLWAIDIQLTEDLDRVQEAYFQQQAEDLSARDRVILCAATPELTYGRQTGSRLQSTFASLYRRVHEQGASVAIQLAGDAHNYQHYVKTEKALRRDAPTSERTIVCGGGGAAHFPTHASVSNPDAVCVKVYPSEAESRRRSLGLFGFGCWERGGYLPVFLAVLHAVSAGIASASPFVGLLAGAFAIAAFGVLASALDRQATEATRASAWALGLGHGLLQVGTWVGTMFLARHVLALPAPWPLVVPFSAAFLALLLHHPPVPRLGRLPWPALRRGVVVLAVLLALALVDPWQAFRRPIAFVLLTGSGGLVLGSLWSGLYLFLALEWLRSHQAAAFSALRIPDYLSFLRLRITPTGDLDIYALGIDRAPRDSTVAVPVRLIEAIRVSGPSAAPPPSPGRMPGPIPGL